MAASQSTINDNDIKSNNVWFAFCKHDDEPIMKATVIDMTFHFMDKPIYETYSDGTIIVGQFLSSNWFNDIFNINSSYSFYVFACDKNVTHKKASLELNRYINTNDLDEKTIFNIFNKFTLTSEQLINTFVSLNNETPGKRIEIQTVNGIHRLSIYISIKHQMSLSNNPGIMSETVMIDTPAIMYYRF